MGIVLLWWVSGWYKAHLGQLKKRRARQGDFAPGLSRRQVTAAIGVLIALVFSKYFYLASFTSYYTFYLMSRFHVSVRSSQIHLFAFLGAVAAGYFGGRGLSGIGLAAGGDLVLHSRHPAAYVVVALCQSVLDRGVERDCGLYAGHRRSLPFWFMGRSWFRDELG